MEVNDNDIDSGNEVGARDVYEVAYHLTPSTTPEEVAAFMSGVHGMLETESAAIIKEEAPKARTLAYTVRRKIGNTWHTFSSSQFGWIKFESEMATSARVKSMLDRDDRVIRFLIVKTSREDTMHHPRYSFGRPERMFMKKPLKDEPKTPMQAVPISEAEIDKEIEALVAE